MIEIQTLINKTYTFNITASLYEAISKEKEVTIIFLDKEKKLKGVFISQKCAVLKTSIDTYSKGFWIDASFANWHMFYTRKTLLCDILRSTGTGNTDIETAILITKSSYPTLFQTISELAKEGLGLFY